MTTQFEYDVFISHSSKDKPVVRELANQLKQDGLRVWLDEWKIQPGDMIGLKIQQGLERSRTLLMVMSNAYFASEWSTLEHHTLLFRDPARKGACRPNVQRRFISVLVKNSPASDSGNFCQSRFVHLRRSWSARNWFFNEIYLLRVEM
jgi:hypothetical protein